MNEEDEINTQSHSNIANPYYTVIILHAMYYIVTLLFILKV